MPVSLAQASQNTTDDLDLQVIDEFRKSSWLLDHMTFDDVVNPAGGGSSLTYGYRRLSTQPTAAFRAINSEYVPTEVSTTRHTVDLKVLGGSFQIDRILAKLGPAASGEVSLQMSQKIKAAKATFADAVINGDEASWLDSFDGLDKILTGTSTELDFNADTTADATAVNTREKGLAFMKVLRKLIARMDGTPDAFLMNADALAALESVAEYVSALTTMEAFGQKVSAWRGIPFIDLGEKAGTSDPVISIATGKTDIYAVRFGLDGFHGVSAMGGDLVWSALPNFNTPGAVKTGEVEMGPVGVVLKATKAAAVARNVKVA